MKRYVLSKNGVDIGQFSSERVARSQFLKVCASCDFRHDVILLVDMDEFGEIIAEY